MIPARLGIVNTLHLCNFIFLKFLSGLGNRGLRLLTQKVDKNTIWGNDTYRMMYMKNNAVYKFNLFLRRKKHQDIKVHM